MTGVAMNVAGCLILYAAGTLSSSAGVGGGALNVPILYNIFGFTYKESVVLSLWTLLGNYISQVFLNIDKRHPSKPTKPLIYWGGALILLPSELGGSNLGVILSAVLPDTFLYFMATLVLMIAGGLTLSKGLNYYEKENAEAEALSGDPDTRPLLASESGKVDEVSRVRVKENRRPFSKVFASIIPAYVTCNNNPEDDNLPPMDIPWLIIQVILGIWVFYAICFVVMNQFDTCSIVYYVILALIYVLLLCELIWGLHYLMHEQKSDPDSIAEGDLHWGAASWYLPILTFGVGILTSLLGIGGGELMGPLMLRLRILPQVSSATTSIMSLLNTSSSVIHYMVLGEVNWTYAPGVFAIGALAGFSGRITALCVAEYFRRPSVMVFSLFAVIAICFIIYVVYIFSSDIDLSFGSLCDRR